MSAYEGSQGRRGRGALLLKVIMLAYPEVKLGVLCLVGELRESL